MDTHEIIEKISPYNYDIVLVEGARDKDIPKIRIGNINIRPNTIYDYEDDFNLLLEKIYEKITL